MTWQWRHNHDWAQNSRFSVKNITVKGRLHHFLRKGSPKFPKSFGINKIVTPLFCNKYFMTPITDTPYPLKQAKIVLKSVFLNKINRLSVVILWLPTFWSSEILWPPYSSLQKFMTPPVYFGPPHSEENDQSEPLTQLANIICWLGDITAWKLFQGTPSEKYLLNLISCCFVGGGEEFIYIFSDKLKNMGGEDFFRKFDEFWY